MTDAPPDEQSVTAGAARGRSVVARTAAVLLCACGVPLLTLVLVEWVYGVPISAYRPLINDEVAYWHQALTFSHVGFNGGYYTLEESTNPSGFTPFGPHGPGFVVLYGLVGWIADWHRHSVVVINLITLGFAGWIWATCARVSSARLGLASAFLTTFWAIPYWAATGMQESFHHTGAIVMAALFTRVLSSPTSRKIAIAGSVILCVLAVTRPTWVILMPLWAVALRPHASRRRLTVSVAAWLAVAAVILLVYSRITAPFSTGFFFLKVMSFSVGFRAVIENLMFNIDRTVNVSDYHRLEILQRVQYWVFLLVGLALIIRGVWKRSEWRSAPAIHLILAAAAMLTALSLMLVLYTLTNQAEYRVLSAFLLFGALVVLAAPGRAPVLVVGLLIVSNAAAAATFVDEFEAGHREHFVWDRRGVYELETALAGRVVYHANQPRWCNTLLTAQYPPYLIGVPSGIGLSVVREPDRVAMPPRSRYLLLDTRSLSGFTAPLNVKALVTLPYGTLYENLDARCEPDAAR
jgi:hypothetical protein